MTVHTIDSLQQYRDLVDSKKLFALDCWATWCGPCKAISPIFERFSEQFDQIEFYKVDIDEQPDIAHELGVRVVPTFYVFKDGEKVKDLAGADPAKLDALLASVA